MNQTYTEEQVYAQFLALIKRSGGTRALARKVGLSPSYISDMTKRARPIAEPVLALLGIRRVVVYHAYYEVTE